MSPRRSCDIDGCERPFKARGYCGTHYWRATNGIPLGTPVRIVDPGRGCLVAGCIKPHKAFGYCSTHYQCRGEIGKVRQISRGRLGSVADEDDPCTWAAAHGRVKALWGSASQYLCVECGKWAKDWAYDGTDPLERYQEASGSYQYYSRFPEFYAPMCRKCHLGRDKSAAAQELREYREFKQRTGMTLSEVEQLLARAGALESAA